MNKLFGVILVSVFLSQNTSFAGGPWTQNKGKAYFKLSEFWIVFDEHFTASGDIDDNTTTGIFNTYLYGEYGLTDRLTIMTNSALFTRSFINDRRSTTGTLLSEGDAINAIGDIDMGLKYQLTSKSSPIVVAASVVFGLPTGRIGAGKDNNLQTGDGEFNQIFRIDAGKGFKTKNNPSYISGYLAFNNRTSSGENFTQRLGRGFNLGLEDSFSDEVRFGLEYGIGLADERFWLIARFYSLESLKNGKGIEGNTNIFANNTEYTGLSLEANYYINDKIGVSASSGGAFRGETIAASPSFNVGVFLDLSK